MPGFAILGYARRVSIDDPLVASGVQTGTGLDRRRFRGAVAGTAGLAGLALVGCSSSDPKSSGPTTTLEASGSATSAGSATEPSTTVGVRACRLIPEMTAGPYYRDDMAVRSDITEDRRGFPLTMAFTVIDASTCEPLPGAAVDIWCCDANGEYSGWNGNTLAETFANGRNDKTYLGGIQVTGADGIAGFSMIYPGWYEGRAIHIHLKVHTGGDAAETYEGGHVNHVGQVFFDDDLSDRLMRLGEYAKHPGTRTRNDADSIYRSGGADQLVTVTARDTDRPEAGFTGAVTLAVDPAATPRPLPVA